MVPMLRAALGVCAGVVSALAEGSLPVLIGADLSWLPEREASGRRYLDGGMRREPLALLKERGFNAVRLRLFHNPAAPGGYSAAGYCGWDSTLAMARRVQAAGFGIFLDFHYSDTWADPAHQVTPSAWAGLGIDALEDSVSAYTEAFLQAMEAQNTLPFLVQIGNEVDPGFMLPVGSSENLANFWRLFEAGAKAVRRVDAGMRVALHLAAGNEPGRVAWFLRNKRDKTDPAAKLDVVGLSCYTEWHGPPSTWQATFETLLEEFPQYEYLIAEYSQEKAGAHAVMRALPQRKGLGAFIWEPLEWQESVFTWTTGNTWTSNALLDLYPGIAALDNPEGLIPVALGRRDSDPRGLAAKPRTRVMVPENLRGRRWRAGGIQPIVGNP